MYIITGTLVNFLQCLRYYSSILHQQALVQNRYLEIHNFYKYVITDTLN